MRYVRVCVVGRVVVMQLGSLWLQRSRDRGVLLCVWAVIQIVACSLAHRRLSDVSLNGRGPRARPDFDPTIPTTERELSHFTNMHVHV